MAKDEGKPFLEHIEDLRWMIIKSAIALGVCMIVTACFAKSIITLLMYPLNQELNSRGLDASRFLVSLGVTDPLNTLIDVALFSGLVLACPFICYFIGEFVVPALTPKEKKFLLPTFLIGGVLFLCGVLFSYFLVLPQTIAFFIEFNEWLGWQPTWTIQNYLDFTLQMLIGCGLAAELPLVILLLAQFGMVTKKMLTEYRRHALVIILIAAACITPSSDPYNLTLVFAPMYVLYELSIWGTAWIEYRRAQRAVFSEDS